MRKFLVSMLLIVVLVPFGLWAADATSDLMGLGMPAALATKVSQVQLRTLAVASLPSTCTYGEILVATDSDDCSAGSGNGAVCVCSNGNTWVLVANAGDVTP